MKKQALFLALALALCLGAMVSSALAADSDFVISNGVLTKYTGSDSTVTVPSGVTAVGEYAFYQSDAVSVILPEGVTSIGQYAFSGCFHLTDISLPSTLTEIGLNAFNRCQSLTHVTIPGSVTTIGDSAFAYCSSLTSVEICDGVETIGKLAFNSTGLVSAVIPDSVTKIASKAFYGCKSLTDVIIGDGVTTISEYAFYLCDSLRSVHIGSGVTGIETCAFANCGSLASITIPSNVTFVQERAFEGSPCLQKIGPFTLVDGFLYEYDGPGGSLVIPDGTTAIGGNLFYNCTEIRGDITSLTLPSSLTRIADGAFGWCTGLTSVVLPDSVTAIGESAFLMCVSLTDITLSKNLTSIPRGAFQNCEALTALDIPSGVTDIGQFAFTFCSGLRSVSFPSSLTSIGPSAFSDCCALERVDIPGSVKTIGSDAFYNCCNMTSATLGSGVSTIGTSAFSRCNSLRSAVIPASVTSIGNVAFSTITETSGGYFAIPGLTIYGAAGSTAQSFAQKFGINFTADQSGLPTQFTDVTAGSYYVDAVTWAVDQGITAGTGNGSTFSPDTTCTNAQILTFLWRAYGEPSSAVANPFADVSAGDYYYGAALWAYEKGLVSGAAFDGDAGCTRAMTVSYLWKAAGSPAPSAPASFTDVGSGADYAGAVAWAVEQGITTGTGDGSVFAPDQICSRGQIVTFLYRNLGQ